MELKYAIEALKGHRINAQRGGFKYSFGSSKDARELFEAAFLAVDQTVKTYKHLPEYDQIIDWMHDNTGKGLFLTGDCGRGKSTILTGVLPVIFLQKFGKVLNPYHADIIPTKVAEITAKWATCIDELGVEPLVNNFGDKYEGFNVIINEAEAKIKPVFLSTNLDSKQILDRYGERTFDRIKRLCRIVKFVGPSFRTL